MPLAATTTVTATGDSVIDALSGSSKWGGAVGTGATLTYSFHTSSSTYGSPAGYAGTNAPWDAPAAPNAAVMSAVRGALAKWSQVANIKFVEVADTGASSGVVRFGLSKAVDRIGEAGLGLGPNSASESGGDVWLSASRFAGIKSIPMGSQDYSVILREIGQALGLTDPFAGPEALSAADDNLRHTILSDSREDTWYVANPTTGILENVASSTPMLYDIKAIQHLYGARTTTNAGNTTYALDPANTKFMSIWDAGGTDIIDASRFVTSVTVNLTPGSFSTISAPFVKDGAAGQAIDNVSIAYGVTIESVKGGLAGDRIYGNDAGNLMEGLTGSDALYGMGGDDRLIGGAGDDLLDGGDGLDMAVLSDGSSPVWVDLNVGTATSSTTGTDTLISIEGAVGTAQSDTFIGNGAGNVFQGHGGNDTFVFSGGADYIDGGIGSDTLTGMGLRRQHDVSLTSGDAHVDGTTARSAETLSFIDGIYVTDVASTAAQAYRLYASVLDRAPDPAGLKSWDSLLKGGMSLEDAAAGFAGSAEFQQKYGSLDNKQFVTLLYNNVLDRAPDAGGMASWLKFMAGGMGKADVVLGFSESAEHVEKTRADVQAGLWLKDDQAAAVARMYDAVLDRQGDAGGIIAWTNGLKGGVTLKALAEGFTGSPEFQQKYGALDDDGFIRLMYRNVLDREGDEGGLSAWRQALDQGATRADIVLGFSESPEHQVKLAGITDDGVYFT